MSALRGRSHVVEYRLLRGKLLVLGGQDPESRSASQMWLDSGSVFWQEVHVSGTVGVDPFRIVAISPDC